MSVTGAIAQKRVLLVDDSKFVRTTFKSILNGSFAVHEAADGEAGWQAIESDPSIVLVFSDLDMPKLDGFGLLAKMRGSTDARIRKLPVIVISGHDNAAAKKRARDLGAHDFIGKSADGPEVLSRIENMLRLVQTAEDLDASKRAIEQTAIRDPLTGAFTLQYLMTEGRKHYSYARRHGAELSVMVFGLDNYDDLAKMPGKQALDPLLAQIAKLVMQKMRTEDSLGRSGEAAFMLISVGTGAPQVLGFARRLQEQLENAQIRYGGKLLAIRASFGAASMGPDAAASIEDLVKLATDRMREAASLKAGRIVARQAVAPIAPASLPDDVERALQVLERTPFERLGAAGSEVLRRLGRIAETLKSRVRRQNEDKAQPAVAELVD